MSKLKATLVIVIGALAIGGTVYFKNRNDASDKLLKIMTWNIGYADLKASAAQDVDMPHIASIIRKWDPDVVALQEQSGPKQLKLLCELLNGRYTGRTTAGDNGRGVAILSKLPVQEWEEVKTCIGWKMLSARIQSEDLARPFRVFSCYAPSGRNSVKRKNMCKELVELVHDSGETAFLAGDFNLTNGSFVDQMIPLLSDDPQQDKSTYKLLTQCGVDCGKDAGATSLLWRRIDYIFLYPKESRVFDCRVISGSRVNAMDHEPLLVQVEENVLLPVPVTHGDVRDI